MADYVLIHFRDRDKMKLDETLNGMIRATDILGMDENENIYLLLVQMNLDNFQIVGKRLEERGLIYEVVEKIA